MKIHWSLNSQTSIQKNRRDAQPTSSGFWLPFSVAVKEIYPRHDSMLCVNENRQVIIVVLPELLISRLRAKIKRENSRPLELAFIQQTDQDSDKSYIAPVEIDQQQMSVLDRLISADIDGKLTEGLKDKSLPQMLHSVKKNSRTWMERSLLSESLRRVEVLHNTDKTQPDFMDNDIPVFVYTDPNTSFRYDEEFHKKVRLQAAVAAQCLDILRQSFDTPPDPHGMYSDELLTQVVSRVEAELLLNLVDPAARTHFQLITWGDKDTIQVILNGGESRSDAAPAITVIRDELGIHTLPTYLFDASANQFSGLSVASIDELKARDTPEIQWQPAKGYVSQSWWLTDSMVKKILWLAVRNLFSHQLKNHDTNLCSVIPMGENAIQVAIVGTERDKGTPYAFLVYRGTSQVDAVPVFPSSSVAWASDGRVIVMEELTHTNYTFTSDGQRLFADVAPLIFRPPFSSVIGGLAFEIPKPEELA